MTRLQILACMAGVGLFGGGLYAADIVIDLKNGVVTETFNTAPTPQPISSDATSGFTDSAGYATVQLAKKSIGACSTPYEGLVEINLSPSGQPPATRFRIQVEHEGTPTGWTTHVGDDANNDGFGGGSGLTGVAELQVLNQSLAVYTIGFNPGEVDKLYGSQLRLTDGALDFTLSDQSLTAGPPRTIIGTPNQKQLFDFSAPDKKMYAAFNRVINGRADRTGCGARRVVITFE